MDDGRVIDRVVALALRHLKKIGHTRFGPVLLPMLMVTSILCRSTGAIALLAMGMMVLWLSVYLRTRLILAGLLLIGPVYVAVRTSNVWSGEQAVAMAETLAGKDRAQSLQFRFECESLLIAKALKQPIWGWGGWGRSDAHLYPGTAWQKRVTTDGIWIVYLGTKGFVGLALFYLAMILAAIRFLLKFPVRLWDDPQLAAASLVAVVLGLYMIDCLLNGFANMIYITLAGGLIGLEPKQLRTMTAQRWESRGPDGNHASGGHRRDHLGGGPQSQLGADLQSRRAV